MISDYFESGLTPRDTDVWGMVPTFDMWGTVMSATDDTGKGNVRVKIETMKDNMNIFDGVPVLTSYGGGDYGEFCLPEEGAVVRLTFIGGDFRHPVVTGCRFPADSRLVKDNYQKENLKKVWKAKNGSSIVFSGDKGKERIQVSGPEKMEWELDEEKEHISIGDKERKNRILIEKKNGKNVLTAEKEIRLECGKSSLELKSDGVITLKCEKLNIESNNVQVKGKSRVQLQGQEVALEGTTGFSINGKAQIKIESKGTMKLSAAMINLN